MEEKNSLAYSSAFQERLEKIIEMTGLEKIGFALFIEISDSHLYALLNGTRKMTGEMADKIASFLKIKSWQITNTDVPIPESIKRSPLLKKFYEDYKGNPEYFIHTKAERKNTYYIKQIAYTTDLFMEPVSVYQVRKFCQEQNKILDSKEIAQTLDYMVKNEELESEKINPKKKNGEPSNREVRVYYKPGSNKGKNSKNEEGSNDEENSTEEES